MSREALIAAKNFIENLRAPQDKLQAVLQINQGAKVLGTIGTALEESVATGVAVLVGGQVVAWFKGTDFDSPNLTADYYQSCQDWCRDNYFGLWLTRPAFEPEVIPFTEGQIAAAEAKAEELSKFFNLED